MAREKKSSDLAAKPKSVKTPKKVKNSIEGILDAIVEEIITPAILEVKKHGAKKSVKKAEKKEKKERKAKKEAVKLLKKKNKADKIPKQPQQPEAVQSIAAPVPDNSAPTPVASTPKTPRPSTRRRTSVTPSKKASTASTEPSDMPPLLTDPPLAKPARRPRQPRATPSDTAPKPSPRKRAVKPVE